MSQLVWYASFGSNLWEDRFRVYLEGGVPPGSTGRSPGARDAAPPAASTTRFCEHPLRFGGSAKQWGDGGVAFLGSEPAGHRTALRMYLITTEQFEDVFFQENGLSEPIALNLEAASEHGRLDALDRRYGRVLHLGNHDDGHDIFTITTADPPPVSVPHHSYVQTIVNGLLTTVDGDNFGFDAIDDARVHLTAALGMDGFTNDDWTTVARNGVTI